MVSLHHFVSPIGNDERGAHENDADDYLHAQHDVAEQMRAAAVHVGGQSLPGIADSHERQPYHQTAGEHKPPTYVQDIMHKSLHGDAEIHFMYQVGKLRVDEIFCPKSHHHGYCHGQRHHKEHFGKKQPEQLSAPGTDYHTQRHLSPPHPEKLHLHPQETHDGGQQNE